jgi:hypothetical protein
VRPSLNRDEDVLVFLHHVVQDVRRNLLELVVDPVVVRHIHRHVVHAACLRRLACLVRAIMRLEVHHRKSEVLLHHFVDDLHWRLALDRRVRTCLAAR